MSPDPDFFDPGLEDTTAEDESSGLATVLGGFGDVVGDVWEWFTGQDDAPSTGSGVSEAEESEDWWDQGTDWFTETWDDWFGGAGEEPGAERSEVESSGGDWWDSIGETLGHWFDSVGDAAIAAWSGLQDQWTAHGDVLTLQTEYGLTEEGAQVVAGIRAREGVDLDEAIMRYEDRSIALKRFPFLRDLEGARRYLARVEEKIAAGASRSGAEREMLWELIPGYADTEVRYQELKNAIANHPFLHGFEDAMSYLARVEEKMAAGATRDRAEQEALRELFPEIARAETRTFARVTSEGAEGGDDDATIHKGAEGTAAGAPVVHHGPCSETIYEGPPLDPDIAIRPKTWIPFAFSQCPPMSQEPLTSEELVCVKRKLHRRLDDYQRFAFRRYQELASTIHGYMSIRLVHSALLPLIQRESIVLDTSRRDYETWGETDYDARSTWLRAARRARDELSAGMDWCVYENNLHKRLAWARGCLRTIRCLDELRNRIDRIPDAAVGAELAGGVRAEVCGILATLDGTYGFLSTLGSMLANGGFDPPPPPPERPRLQTFVRTVLSFVPIVGAGMMIAEAIRGRDMFGNELSQEERNSLWMGTALGLAGDVLLVGGMIAKAARTAETAETLTRSVSILRRPGAATAPELAKYAALGRRYAANIDRVLESVKDARIFTSEELDLLKRLNRDAGRRALAPEEMSISSGFRG